MSASPSSGVSRSPAIALSSTGAMSIDKVDSLGSDLLFDGQLVEAGQHLALGTAQSVRQVPGQAMNGDLFGKSQERRITAGNGAEGCDVAVARRRQNLVRPAEAGAV